jgi:hypothetical protein
LWRHRHRGSHRGLCGRDCRAGRGCRGGRTSTGKLVDLVDQGLTVKGLHQVAVGLGLARADFVEGLEGSSEKEHWNLAQSSVGFDRLRQIVAVATRHHDVGHHDVGADFPRLVQGVLAVVHDDHLRVLDGEGDLDGLLNRDAVVREQQRAGHSDLGQTSGRSTSALPRHLSRTS